MYGNNCSDYDFLSHCGNRGVYMDSGENRTAYHVHYGESVPCGVSVPVHVRCGRVLLHSYQKLVRVFAPICSAIFLLSVPAYADEVEASEQNIEVVEHEVENVSLAKEEASNLDNERLGEILSSPVLRSPSINPELDFNYIGFTTNEATDGFTVSIIFEGNIPDPYTRFRVDYRNNGVVGYSFALPSDFISGVIPYDSDIIAVRLMVDNALANGNQVLWTGNVSITQENVGSSVGGVTNVGIASYLSYVGEVFTWLLATIGTLIAFILGNPFLAVSLLLFLAGSVISFYIRIKNA